MAALFEQADLSGDYDWASELWEVTKTGLNQEDQESMRKHRLKIILANPTKDPDA